MKKLNVKEVKQLAKKANQPGSSGETEVSSLPTQSIPGPSLVT